MESRVLFTTHCVPSTIISHDSRLPTRVGATSSIILALPLSITRRISLVGASLAPLLQPHNTIVTQKDELEEEEERAVHLFQEATKSVVCIKVLEVLTATTTSDAKVEGTGSGFIWDQFGHLVTNYHVVAKLATDKSGTQQVQVSLLDPNGMTVTRQGRIIGIDPPHDLAVLKIDIEENLLHPMPIGTSKNLKVGQNCYALGNPYGYEHTLTSGVVSGLGRLIPSPAGRPILGAIQTDAAINAGNSGGPLLDSFGRAIGVNTATFTRQGSGMSSGVNFAIPIDLVYETVPALIVKGTMYHE